jgi:hypothetical protein
MAVSALYSVGYRMIGSLERICKEAARGLFEILARYLLRRIGQNHERHKIAGASAEIRTELLPYTGLVHYISSKGSAESAVLHTVATHYQAVR